MLVAAVLAAGIATLDPAHVDALLGAAEHAMQSYVFPDVAKRVIADLRAHRPEYEHLTDPAVFVRAVNAQLASDTHDKHVRMYYPFDAQLIASDDSAAALAAQHADELHGNFGFHAVRRLPGNVGYLDFRHFSGDAAVGGAIAAAMTFVANTDALIIDLRHNGGGATTAAQTLEAYFFADQQQLTSLMLRDPATGVVHEQQQYTAATVAGPMYLDKPIYILTGERTFSCAEQFTYDLRNLKRVTIVGQTTGGGANPGDMLPLGSSFALFVPTGRAYSPVTKTNWEGTGIAPDVAVPTADALPRAYVLALDALEKKQRDAELQAEATRAKADPATALADGE